MIKHKTISAFYWLIGISIFLLPLIHAWMIYPLGIESLHTNYAAFGGILPSSDANNYYNGANTLLEQGFLDEWNTRRPLNAILFSVRLWLANNNFQAALIIQAILCSISCLLLTSVINKTFGKLTSAITFIVLFLFASLFLPTTLSETLGLTIGAISFVILWEAIRLNNCWLLFTAGLTLTIGLNTRAGAFFILPILIIWILHIYKKKSAFSFTAGIIGGFLFNLILIKIYSTEININAPHANFATTLFGLVSGGKNWLYAYTIDHKTIINTEADLAKYLYIESFNIFKNNPLLLLKGILNCYLNLIKSIVTIFKYWVLINNNIIFKISILFTSLTASIWFIYNLCCFKNFYKNQNIDIKNKIMLLKLALISMILSAGILWTDGGFRVFAVTVPFFAVLSGLIIGYRLMPVNINKKNDINWETKAAIIIGYTLIITGLIVPKLINSKNNYQIKPIFNCRLNQSRLIVKNIFGSPKISSALIKNKRFKHHLLKNPDNNNLLNILKSDILDKPTFLGSIYDLNSNSTKYILGAKEIFLNKNTCIGLCTTPIPGIEGIMQIQSFKVLNNKASDEQ